MPDHPDLLDIAQRVAKMASNGEQLEVYVARGRSTTVKVYGGDVESLSSAQSQGLGIRVIREHRQGFAHAGSLDDDVIVETLRDARDNVMFGEPDEFYGLAEPDHVEPVEQDLWCQALVDFPPAKKVEVALELERAVKGKDDRVTGVRSANYGDSAGEAAVATTNGMSAYGNGTFSHISVTALAVADGETKVGGGVDVCRDPNELDLEKAATDAVERAVRLFGAKKVPSQRLTIMLEPRLAATLIGLAGGTLTGERVLKGRSPFAHRRGEQIASTALTLVDDPTDARSMAADTFDGEALACRRNVLIDAGTLDHFLHNSYTGRRSGNGSTGSAVRSYRSTPSVGCQALSIVPGERSHDELLAEIGTGLSVQSLTGLHSGVNAISGDFSVGAEGLMIRGGALAEPVRGVTIASTLQRLLLDIAAVGSDLEWLPGGTGACSLVIDDVSLSGT